MMPDTIHDRAETFAFHVMKGGRFDGIPEARRYMLEQWSIHDAQIPGWVDLDRVELDLAYTMPEAAKSCVDDLLRTIPEGVTFVEPSAGRGAFLKHLPKDTVAMDVLPRHDMVKRGEFLTYEPPGPGPYCVVGAPPFGDRLWLTNAFITHALDMAECVGFIVDAKSVRDAPNGTIHHVTPLGSNAMRGMSGGRVRRRLEWRVWRASK